MKMAIRRSRRCSIAQARQGLAGIIHDVERHGPVEVTRRGETVAVLVPAAQWRRVAEQGHGFWKALQEFRGSTAPQDWPTAKEWVAGARDRSRGRDFRW